MTHPGYESHTHRFSSEQCSISLCPLWPEPLFPTLHSLTLSAQKRPKIHLTVLFWVNLSVTILGSLFLCNCSSNRQSHCWWIINRAVLVWLLHHSLCVSKDALRCWNCLFLCVCVSLQSFRSLPQKPLSVDLTVEDGQRLKVIYGSLSGFHAIDVDSGTPYDLYLPTHVRLSIIHSAVVSPDLCVLGFVLLVLLWSFNWPMPKVLICTLLCISVTGYWLQFV